MKIYFTFKHNKNNFLDSHGVQHINIIIILMQLNETFKDPYNQLEKNAIKHYVLF
jgi:hypothetical protein